MNKLHQRIAHKLRGAQGKPVSITKQDVFPTDLIVHVTYHKCLTLYYKRIIQPLSEEFRFSWKDYFGDSAGFNKDAVMGRGKRILALTDRDDVAWDNLPSYRGSHFVRDPRDLIVSGYHYHLWTNEPWCNALTFPWHVYTKRQFFELVEPDPGNHPRNVSYQSYLKTLDPERGMILEMIFRGGAFLQMGRWNYNNPDVLELRYEHVIGNEAESFRRLFDHYRFHRRVAARGIELCKKFSLENQKKGDGKHQRSGEIRQWESELPPRVKELFKLAHGNLLIHLGYEQDLNW